MAKYPAAVAQYYQSAKEPHKSILVEMRERVLEVIPGADEIIKYGMPTFVVNGQPIAGLMVHTKHVGFYPYSGSILVGLPNLTSKYKTTKGALHIPLDKPLLKSEVKQLIKARLALK
jgi:uncharacterized protein YdhG (YjbR/CyaY superfamily)